MIHVMLDLETFGNKTNPAIIQIAAVAFNLDGTLIENGEFNVLINPSSCVKRGLKVDQDTVTWWLKQDKSVVEKVFAKSIIDGSDLEDALGMFSMYLSNLRNKSDDGEIRVWGNGIYSDNKWLGSAYEACNMNDPIRHWQHSDVRTIVDLGINLLGKDIKSETSFDGEKHNAIDDCKHQIKYLTQIIREIKEK